MASGTFNARSARIVWVGGTLLLAAALLLPLRSRAEERPFRSRLVPVERLQELERKALAAAETNRTRQCVRPVLRGEARPGSADAAMIATIEGAPEIRPCFDLLDDSGEALTGVIHLPSGDAPARRWSTARPLDDPEGRGALLDRVVATCAPLVAKLREAVSHEDACSPYLIGRRGTPKLLYQLRGAKVLAATARKALADGKPREALAVLLDGLRFQQDMYRGGASFLYPMVSAAASSFLAPTLELALDAPQPLGDELLADVQRELTLLLDAEPHLSGILRGESESSALYLFLGGLKPREWTPPGGWGEERASDPPPAESRLPAAVPYGADDRDDLAVAWLAADEQARDWQRACPPTATTAACQAGMERIAERIAERVESQSEMSRWFRMLRAEDPKEDQLRQIIEILKAVGSPVFGKYVRRYGQVGFLLAAARLHAGFRALAEKGARCPERAAFDAAPLSALRALPWDGSPIEIAPAEGGGYVLSPAPDLRSAPDDPPVTWRVRCPIATR